MYLRTPGPPRGRRPRGVVWKRRPDAAPDPDRRPSVNRRIEPVVLARLLPDSGSVQLDAIVAGTTGARNVRRNRILGSSTNGQQPIAGDSLADQPKLHRLRAPPRQDQISFRITAGGRVADDFQRHIRLARKRRRQRVEKRQCRLSQLAGADLELDFPGAVEKIAYRRQMARRRGANHHESEPGRSSHIACMSSGMKKDEQGQESSVRVSHRESVFSKTGKVYTASAMRLFLIARRAVLNVGGWTFSKWLSATCIG